MDRRTGEELTEPRIDFSEFTTGDILYPSMMKPEVKRRWDQKQYEKEETKAAFEKLKRMVHAQFMDQNPSLPVVQKLKQTTYGNEIQTEFKKHLSDGSSRLKPKAFQSRTPQIGTGKSIRDELERDNVDINEIADEVLQFLTPKSENTYAVLAVNRDENLRIEDKLLVSAQSSHVLEYQYDEGGRLELVKYNGDNVEIYRYNQLGQRVFSHVANSDKLEYRYNDLGQLVRAGEPIYTYDEDGDLSEKNSPEGITRYEYLKTGQLCEVHLPDGTDIEYRFDKRGFRTAKYINGQLAQRYQWKDLTTLAAVEDAGGISKFHYNEHGRVMGMVRNGQVFLFATDQLGSIFTVADSSGNSLQEILYDSFGRRVYNSNPEHDPVLGFGGGLYDSDTGLIHFGYREYDPVIGRFISPDPLGYGGGDVDLYGYCLDDPINFVDRDGLQGQAETADEKSKAKTSSLNILDRNINKIAESRYGKDTAKHLSNFSNPPKPEKPAQLEKKSSAQHARDVDHLANIRNKYPEPKDNYPFTEDTFKFLGQNKDAINKSAEKFGVSAEAVAGAIGDEKNRSGWFDKKQDEFVPQNADLAKIENQISKGQKSKLFLAGHDIGPGNMNVATLHEIYKKRFENGAADDKLKQELSEVIDPNKPREEQWKQFLKHATTPEGTATLAAAHMEDAAKKLEPHMKGLSPEEKNAVLVTYYKQGPKYIDKYLKNIEKSKTSSNSGTNYSEHRPIKPGEGVGLIYQYSKIKEALRGQ